jgi:uncharacterized protein (TIGR03435 family)
MPAFSIRALPGGLTARNISLKRLVAMGYSVTDCQIFGAIAWLESARFDLEAKAPGPAQLPQLRLMVRAMLDDRFKLKTHRETRELPIYSLVLAKSGLKGGPGFVESLAEIAVRLTRLPGLRRRVCRLRFAARLTPPGRIFGQHGRMSQLADRLATLLGRTVVDKTGLDGAYDIELTFAPDADMAQAIASGTAHYRRPGAFAFYRYAGAVGSKAASGQGTGRSYRYRRCGETHRELTACR